MKQIESAISSGRLNKGEEEIRVFHGGRSAVKSHRVLFSDLLFNRNINDQEKGICCDSLLMTQGSSRWKG